MSDEALLPPTCFNQRPNSDFDWKRVRWRTFRMEPPKRCGYCSNDLATDAPRIIVCDNAGYRAEFCETCMVTYWGGRTAPRRRR
jgi:hypothetical protein